MGFWFLFEEDDAFFVVVEDLWCVDGAEAAGDTIFGDEFTCQGHGPPAFGGIMNEFILAVLAKQNKLKASSFYQLLKGKRTSSVLCWGYFYDCLPYFGAFPELSEKQFETRIQQLAQEGWLKEVEGVLTLEKEFPQPELVAALTGLDLFRYGRRSDEAWRSLQLLVQAVANLGFTKAYIPVENSPQYTEPVRRFLRQEPELKEALFTELTALFTALPQAVGDALAATFTGKDLIGATAWQAAPQFKVGLWSQVYLESCKHRCYHLLEEEPTPVLADFLAPLLAQNQNQSMLASKELLQQGFSVAEVMQQRGLKRGTVTDHLLEWALTDDDFAFERYVTGDEFTFLNQFPGDFRSWRYRDIRQERELPFDVFRLYQIWRKRGELHDAAK